MTNRERFIKAHTITRESVARFGGDYRVTFGAALSYLYKNSEEKGMSEKKENFIEMIHQSIDDHNDEIEYIKTQEMDELNREILEEEMTGVRADNLILARIEAMSDEDFDNMHYALFGDKSYKRNIDGMISRFQLYKEINA